MSEIISKPFDWNDNLSEIAQEEPILNKISGYINHIKNTGLGKKKSLEFIEKYINGLKAERKDKK